MPWGLVELQAGINVEFTPTLLKAGYFQSSLIRFRGGLAEKLGGWLRLYPSAVAGVPKAMHAWADLNTANHLAVATTTQLNVITGNSLKDITPQTLLSNFAPNFST